MTPLLLLALLGAVETGEVEEPAWVQSTIGEPDPQVVPPPFTQVERTASAAGLMLGVVGRTIDLQGQGLPRQISSAGAELLAEPVQIAGSADGQALRWQWQPPELRERTASSVAWLGTASGPGGWRLAVNGRLDYDGLMTLDLRLVPPPGGGTVERLVFDLPLRPERALFHTSWPGRWGSTANSGPLPAEGLSLPFKPLLWVGDHDRGISVCAESDEGWRPADPTRVLTVDTARRISVQLIGRPTPLERTWRTRLLLHPTPIKPMPADPHALRLNHGGAYGLERQPWYGQSGQVTYPAGELLDPRQGTLELWLSPGFDPNVELTPALAASRGTLNRELLTIRLPNGDEAGFYWNIDDRGMRYYVRRNNKVALVVGHANAWQRDEVHQVALTWGDAIRIYADGKLVAEKAWDGLFGAPVETAGLRLMIGGETATFGLHAVRVETAPRTEFAPDGPPQATPATSLLEVGDQVGSAGQISGGTRAAGRYGPALYFFEPEARAANRLDALQQAGVRTLVFHEHWTDIQDYGYTPYEEQLRSLVRELHDRGMRLAVYFGYEMSDRAPEWERWHEQCLVAPRAGGYQRDPAQTAYIVCFKSPWQNFLLEHIAHAVDSYGVDGVYLDGTIEPWGCANEHHGCGYLGEDGQRHPTYPILAVRQLMRRMYTLLAARRQPVVIDAHQSLCMMSPTLSWCSGYWDGEQLTSNVEPGRGPLDYLPLATFQAEFMGRQWGIPAMFLNYAGKPFEPEEAMAFSLLHDVLPRGHGLNAVQRLVTPLWNTLDRFGRGQAEFVGYWAAEPWLAASPATIKASVYVHPAPAWLVVVSNLGEKVTTARLAFSEKLPANLTAVNALDGQPLPIEGRSLSLSLPALGYQVIEVRPSG